MSRVLLVSTNLCVDPYPVYPLGMSTVAGALDRAGHQVRQFDLLAADGQLAAYAEALAAWRPDVVCLSIRNLDSTDSLWTEDQACVDSAQAVVAATRAAGRWPIVIGGPAVSLLPEEVLAWTGADHAVVGEGERSLCRLLDDFAAGKCPPTVIRPDGLLAAADIGPPLYDLTLARHYVERSGLLNVQSRRGCPFGCAYCTYPHLEGKRYRHLEAAAIVDTIERLQRDAGAPGFFFADSVFNDPEGNYLAIAEELLRRQVKVRWSAFFTPGRLRREELTLCKRAGLFAIELGTDAASDRTLRGMNKAFTFAEVAEVNAACAAEHIPVAHFVIFGGPSETRDTVLEGIANLDALDHCVVFGCSGVRILPGSPLHRQALAEGIVTPETPLLQPITYHSADVDVTWMNQHLTATWAKRHDRIFPSSRDNQRLHALQRMGMRGIIWDQLIRY